MNKYISFNTKALLYTFRIVVGCVIVWFSLNYLHDSKKIWALISVIVVSEPDLDSMRVNVWARVVNTLTGGIIGLVFIYFTGVHFLSLMTAIAVSIILVTSFKKYPSSWKLAPTTVAIVMVPAIVDHDLWREAMLIAAMRTGEVLYGSVVAFVLGVIMTALKKRFLKEETHVEA